MSKTKLSFRAKMLLPIMVMLIAAFLITGVSVYSVVKKEVGTLAETNAWSIAEKAVGDIKKIFADALTAVDTLADTAELITVSQLDEKQIFNYLKDASSKNAELYSMYIIWDKDKRGPSVSMKNGAMVEGLLDPKLMVGEAWYDKPMASNGAKSFISDPFTYDYGSGPVSVISITKAFMINGKVVGVVGVDIAADTIFKYTSNIKVYDTGYAYLMSNKHILLTHPKKELIGNVSSLVDKLKGKTPTKKTFLVPTLSLTTGKVVQNFYQPVTFARADEYYYIGMSVPNDEMLAAVDKVRNLITIIAVLANLAVAVVVFLLVRGLMKMLGGEPQQVIYGVNEIANGNFTVALPVKQGDNSSLIHHINIMATELKDIISKSMEISEQLRTSSADLSSGAQELSAGMGDQAQQTEEISSAASEMSATTVEIASNLDNIMLFTNETSEKVENGVAAVDEALKDITRIKDTADHASAIVDGLEVKSTEISSIIETITSIADQTNLLALNAAIEAARAGDAGRGFAVVADEVRKLAEKTQHSTSEISHLVTEVRNEVNNVAKSMDGVNTQVEQGMHASQGISTVLQEIDDVVAKLKDMIESISGATHEMSATSEQIQRDISGVAVVSSQVRVTTDHLAQNATSLDSISEMLRDMMRHFKI